MVSNQNGQRTDLPVTQDILNVVPQQQFANVEQLSKLVSEVMSTNDMRLRSKISPQMLTHLIRMEVFAEHYDSKVMRGLITYILETHVSVGGWGMGNLIRSLMSLRPTYNGMDGELPVASRNLFRRVIGR